MCPLTTHTERPALGLLSGQRLWSLVEHILREHILREHILRLLHTQNDLLWGFLVVRDFGKPWSFASAPLTAAEGGDHTWRGTYRALLLKRQIRRTAGMECVLFL